MRKQPLAGDPTGPVPVPDLSELPVLDEILESVHLAELNPVALCRIRAGGDTRFNLTGVTHLCTLGRLHNAGPQFSWVTVKQGKVTGSLFLIPTDEKDPDRIAVHWYDAGRDVGLTLNKVLRIRKIHISPGHALVCTCHLANVPKVGAVLELRLSGATAEPVNQAPEPQPAPEPAPAPAPGSAAGAALQAAAGQMPPTPSPRRRRRR